ncbi:MAG TPA: C40 family peptidase [Jatrophihabitans sp.]|nr:C40 family peptidase [Jatrophihabitans sp.]
MTHRVYSHAATRPPLLTAVPPTGRRRLITAGRRLAVLPVAALLAGAGLGVAGSSAAATLSGHNPVGHLDAVLDAGQSSIGFRGWTADPDALTQPLTVLVTVDGAPTAYLVTDVNRPDVTAAVGAGPQAGFASSLVVPAGSHQICVAARNVGAGASVWFGCASATVAGLPPDQAVHNPAGYLDSAATPDTTSTTVSVRGWAVDPDAPSQPLPISATVDGRVAALSNLTAQPRPDVAAAMHSGPDQGYTFDTVIATNGQHTVCVNAANVGAGAPVRLGCSTVQVGPPPLTPAQIAAHSPSGALEAAGAVTSTDLRVRGWASDPDNLGYPLTVQAFVDGVGHTPVRADVARPDLAGNPKAGGNSGYYFDLAVPAGTHNVCLWATNIGIGANQPLGCLALTTPATAVPVGPAPVPPPVNAKIVAAAQKLLGSKYVWGAEDPKVGFDCSGLVQYTYRGAGVSTPRVAQDQFKAAHLIAATRAVPGDLVFYHDSYGAVYHVGIYVSRGVSYAAVDPANGVRVQQIWDSTATYGSFTHA